jgi:hypothetical protein
VLLEVPPPGLPAGNIRDDCRRSILIAETIVTRYRAPALKSPGVQGWASLAERFRAARRASVLVALIWIENSPFVIKEAFAAGVPVVASNLGGMAELVEDGRNGLLFEAGSSADLRRVLARLLDEPRLLSKLREGIARVKSVDEDAAWTQSVYEETLASLPARTVGASRTSIAAVVLNYNTPDDTLLAVRSLHASRRPLDHLIVVDNGPGDA